MRRGMWSAAWHDRPMVASPSSSLGSLLQAGIFPRTAGLFPCNRYVVRPLPSAVGMRASAEQDYSQQSSSRALLFKEF